MFDRHNGIYTNQYSGWLIKFNLSNNWSLCFLSLNFWTLFCSKYDIFWMIKKTLHNSINDFYETSLNYSCCFLFYFYLLWKLLGKNNITKVFSYFVSFQSNAGHSIIIVILLVLHVYQAAWSFIYENLENFNSIILSMHKIRVCIENISRTEVFDVITKTRTVLQIIIF